MASVPERVEKIAGHYGDLTPRQAVTLGQLMEAESPAVAELEAIAAKIVDLSNEMQRNRDERTHLSELLREKLASVLVDPHRYMWRGLGDGETPEVPQV